MRGIRSTLPALLLAMAPAGLAQNFSFQTPVAYAAQNAPLASATADFNGDGKLDLVSGNAGSQSLSIFFGKGDGSFSPGPVVQLTSPCAIQFISTGDFNGDGKPDLLAVCSFSTSLWVALNTGNGQFGTPIETQLPSYAYEGWAINAMFEGASVADFNQDGKLDLALDLGPRDFNKTWTINLLLGNGNGTFQPPAPVLAQQITQALGFTAADLNGDGIPDLAIVEGNFTGTASNPGPGTLVILTGDGHGAFQQQAAYPLSYSPIIGLVTVADVDADGIPDMIVGGSQSLSKAAVSILVVFTGRGNGTFQQVFNQTDDFGVIQLLAGDFRGTGNIDIVEGAIDPGQPNYDFRLRAGNGDGSFQVSQAVLLPNSGFDWLFNLTAGDFNNDGLPDLVYPNLSTLVNSSGGGGNGNPTDLTVVAGFLESGPPGELEVLLNAAPPPPPRITSVVNGASFQPGFESGSWVTIFGSHLASDIRPWALPDFNSNNLPLALDGTSVSIDGKAAAVYYINPGQLDVQAPTDSATGRVSVVVTHNGLQSQPFSAQLQAYAPAFFLYSGTSYAIVSHLDFSLSANPGVIPGTTPAKPGEVVILWGTGFGPTIPATPAGILFSGAPAAASLSTVTIGGQTAGNIGTALSPGSVGLYQVAIQLPATLAPGPQQIQASIGGESSPAGILIFVGSQ